MNVQQRLSGNLWKYTLLLTSNKRVFAAVLGAYYLTIPEVTPEWIGIILLAGSLSGFIFEIPSGYISDKIGHKSALVISRLALLISTTLLLLTNSVLFLIIAAIFLSLSSAFLSGTGSAFLHETLRGLGREHEYTKIAGKIRAISFAVPIALTVAIPFFVGISYKIPFLISLVIDAVGLGAALLLVRPRVSEEHVAEVGITNFKEVLQEGIRLRFLRFALFSGVVSGVLFAVNGFRAPYQVVLEIPVVWFGVLFGIGRALASLLLAYSGAIKELIGDCHAFNRIQIAVYGALFLVLGITTTWWVVALVFIFINGLQFGLSQVQEGYLLEMIQKSKFKATLLSVNAQFGELTIAVCSLGLGFMIERSSYTFGFLLTAVLFAVVLIPLYLYTRHE